MGEQSNCATAIGASRSLAVSYGVWTATKQLLA